MHYSHPQKTSDSFKPTIRLQSPPQNLMQEFAEALKRAIDSTGENQTSLAEALDLTQPTFGRYLKGALPKDETLDKIIAHFNAKGGTHWGFELARAWVRSRLGAAMADEILALKGDTTLKDSMDPFADTTPEFAKAVRRLIARGRIHKEVRAAVESLAAALGDTPFPKG